MEVNINSTGSAFVPKTPETFGYDLDGNLTSDGRFSITWDAENRATSFTSLTNTPAASRVKVDCTYDSQWRRTQKIVSTWNQSTLNYQPSTTNRFVYDGWNLVGILDQANTLLYSFASRATTSTRQNTTPLRKPQHSKQSMRCQCGTPS